MAVCASDWIGLRCGDLVHEIDNPRHVGIVRAVLWGHTVRVVWKDNGWISDLPLADVVKVKEDRS